MFGLKTLKNDIRRHAKEAQQNKQDLADSLSAMQESVHEKLTSPISIASSFGAGALLGSIATRTKTETKTVKVAEDVTLEVDKAQINSVEEARPKQGETMLGVIKDITVALVIKEASVLMKEVAHEEIQKLRKAKRQDGGEADEMELETPNAKN